MLRLLCFWGYLCWATLLIVSPSTVEADEILFFENFDNMTDTTPGANSFFCEWTASDASSLSESILIAHQFIIPEDETWNITTIGVVGAGSATHGAFHYWFFHNSGAGLPDGVLAQATPVVQTYDFVNGLYRIVIKINTLALGPGTYWVTVDDNTAKKYGDLEVLAYDFF